MPENYSAAPVATHRAPARAAAALLFGMAALVLGGCFSEHSFPMNPAKAMTFTPAQMSPDAQPLSARNWTSRASTLASGLLPDGPDALLTTEKLSENGQPINVYRFFDINPDNL